MNNEHIFFWRQNDASLVYSSHTTSIVELKVVTPPCDVVVVVVVANTDDNYSIYNIIMNAYTCFSEPFNQKKD